MKRFISTLLNDAGRWTMLTQHESRNTGAGAQMRYLRKCMGKTRRNRIRNGQIIGTLNQERVIKMVHRRELRWFGHILMMARSRTEGE